MHRLRAHSRRVREGFLQVAHPNCWEIPIKHSVDPERYQLISYNRGSASYSQTVQTQRPGPAHQNFQES